MKDKEFRPLLEEDWKKIKAKTAALTLEKDSPDIAWNYYISEPFPSVWPPASELTVFYYVYSEGHDLYSGFQEGLYVSAPWARIEYDFKKNQVIEINILGNNLIVMGIQGIQPMNGHEIGIFDRAVSIGQYLLSDKKERSTKHLKNYYCLWIKHHATIVEKILPHHKDFISWLACK